MTDLYVLRHIEAGPLATFATREDAELERQSVREEAGSAARSEESVGCP